MIFKSWDSMCLPRKEGGVNIKEILSWNKTQLMAWIRKLEFDSNTIWVKWIKVYILKGQSIWEFQPTAAHSWAIHSLISRMDTLIQHTGSLVDARNLLCKPDFIIQIYEVLRPKGLPLSAYKTLGDTLNFPKHTVIGLLAVQNSLSTLDNFCLRGIPLANRCALCQCQTENRNHLFFECAFSSVLWLAVARWFRIPAITSFPRLLRWFKECNRGVSLFKR
ncbi:uncharacterized protein LOC141590214 [Silene latifolia]|uniref:uncharacterized protein LOC141590214 n=1 Tax=Silene latifolia TaxID=37657 RepID=UPI003D7861AB